MREGGDVTGVPRAAREGGAADVAHAGRGRGEKRGGGRGEERRGRGGMELRPLPGLTGPRTLQRLPRDPLRGRVQTQLRKRC